jgi:membrane-bound lytic murein transglycosylase MltF
MRSGRTIRLIASPALALLLGAFASPLAAQQKKPSAAPAAPKAAPAKAEKDTHELPTQLTTFTGDFDGMRKRRTVRVLVVYNKTNYFIDRGQQRGLTYDGFKMFEDYINKKYKTGNLKIHVAMIPTARKDLAEALLSGHGDIIAANVTMTPERQAKADFADPVLKNVSEVVVSGPDSPPVATAEDLSGREVFVRKGSIFDESIQALNAELSKKGKPPVKERWAPDDLEDEDLLEMLNAGLVQYVVADDFLANFWAKVLPKIKVNPDATLRKDAQIGWAIRKNSPLLKAELNEFIAKNPEGSANRNMLLAKYLKSTKFVKNAASVEEIKKFDQTVAFFKKYGDQYDVDYLLMAAQGYQESQLNQNAKSQVGAVGVMQVMPATGKDMKVGDISQLEPNINAGVKYVRFMIDQYFANEPMDQLNKGLFAFAAYNCGPGRVASLRKEAAKQGLDPNKWFNNVELIAEKRIGRETVTYVSNIYKYYIAYKLATDTQAERKKDIQEVKKTQ